MMILPMWRGAWLVTFVIVVYGAQEQKPPTVIEGVTLDAGTRAPLAGVTVALAPADTADNVVTGGAGGFRFAEIPAGKYRVSAKLDGYREAARFIELKTAASQEKITLALTPLSSIAGRVLDENGEPVVGVEVMAGSGHKAETDAVGKYKLGDLSIGEYRLTFRLPITMRRGTTQKNEQTGEVFGYADRIYYPGVTDARAAAMVTVTPRVPMEGIDIKVKRTRLVEVAGRVLDKATGQPLPKADIELVATGAYSGDNLERKRAGADGAFMFELVPPGLYDALVRREGGAKYNSAPIRIPLDVGQRGVGGAELRIPEYVTLRVNAILPNAANALPNLDWPALSTLIVAWDHGASSLPCRFGSGDPCVIAGIPPGPLRLQVGSLQVIRREGTGKPRTFRVKSVRFGQEDAANMTIMVAEGANPPLEVTFTDQAGTIAATVLNEDGQDAESAAFRVSRVDGDLSIPVPDVGVRRSYSPFSIAGLVPGEYWIAAFPAPDDGSYIRTMMPEKCGDRAARVMITDGQTTAVTLHRCMAQ